MLASEVMSKLATLRHLSGGRHVAISRTFDWFESGNTIAAWSAYRGDIGRSYHGKTMEEAIDKAIRREDDAI